MKITQQVALDHGYKLTEYYDFEHFTMLMKVINGEKVYLQIPKDSGDIIMSAPMNVNGLSTEISIVINSDRWFETVEKTLLESRRKVLDN